MLKIIRRQLREPTARAAINNVRSLFVASAFRQVSRLRLVDFALYLFIVDHDHVEWFALILEKFRDGRAIGVIRDQGSGERSIDCNPCRQIGEPVAGQDCILAEAENLAPIMR